LASVGATQTGQAELAQAASSTVGKLLSVPSGCDEEIQLFGSGFHEIRSVAHHRLQNTLVIVDQGTTVADEINMADQFATSVDNFGWPLREGTEQ
jgi:transketolase N-terminal domain/subunit